MTTILLATVNVIVVTLRNILILRVVSKLHRSHEVISQRRRCFVPGQQEDNTSSAFQGLRRGNEADLITANQKHLLFRCSLQMIVLAVLAGRKKKPELT